MKVCIAPSFLFSLVTLLNPAVLYIVDAGDKNNVLVKEGYRLVTSSSPDSSKLTSRGQLVGSSVYNNGQCKSLKYMETCSELTGTTYDEKDGLDGRYVIDGDKVTSCKRYRSEWQCNQCTQFGGCQSSKGENHGGSRTTYKLEAAPGKIIALQYIDKGGECYKVCTNKDGTLAIGGDEDKKAQCNMGDGWYLVDTTYDTSCDLFPSFQCKAKEKSCQGYSLSKGWMDDCCPGMYCNERCYIDKYNDRKCTAAYQPCSSDSDCCVGMECRDFVVNYAAKGCIKKEETCRPESYRKDDDEVCCEGTKVAQYIDDDDGDVTNYCKATKKAIKEQEASDPNQSGSSGSYAPCTLGQILILLIFSLW